MPGGRRALVVSVALHVAALATITFLPDRGGDGSAELEYAEVEVIEWVAAEATTDSTIPPPAESTAPSPTPDPTQADVTPEPTAPPPPEDERRLARPRGDASGTDPREPMPPTPTPGAGLGDPAPPTRGPEPGNPDVVVPPADAEPSRDPAEPQALALSGLRSSRAGREAPRLPYGSVPAPDRPRPGPTTGKATAKADTGEFETPAAAGFKRKKDGRLVYRDPDPGASWTAELLPDGRVRFKDRLVKPGLTSISGPGLQVMMMKAEGFEFWAARKKRLLKATRKMRLKMAVDFASKNIDRQLGQLYRDLLAIWTSNKPPHTRRGLIFETWDDCEEHLKIDLGDFNDSHPSKIDKLRKDAGEEARTKIIAFIQRHIPKDSADAFTTKELVAMNGRRSSSARFEPYAGS